MSHDRGCFKCHEDPSSYASCTRTDCPKRERAPQHFAVEPGGDKSDAPVRSVGKHPALGAPYTKTEARTCESCGRTEALWSNCFRLASECPQRGGRPFVRIITVTEPGYDVALFFNEDGGAEAVITRPGDKVPIGVNIIPPAKGRRIVVERHGNTFEVLYRDAVK